MAQHLGAALRLWIDGLSRLAAAGQGARRDTARDG
jgi:hypothetical protein